ncbi:hypothetical protein CPB85DRAFT_881297 [Mucidula mucida]|nr:hypothetical protein CPB85DRAFT_881297 [Mucidula mucida]
MAKARNFHWTNTIDMSPSASSPFRDGVGLLMQFALNSPSDAKPGMGFRRVVWEASSVNEKSIAAAKRMGLLYEGTLR